MANAAKINLQLFDDLPFLEPHHKHDPSAVPNLIHASEESLSGLPETILPLVEHVQDAASIVWASKQRLDSLLADRLDHLLPNMAEPIRNVDDEPDWVAQPVPKKRSESASSDQFSEPAFFSYQSRVDAEKRYLLMEALVDWQSKVHGLEGYIKFCERNNQIKNTKAIENWLEFHRDVIVSMRSWVEELDVPDFESTVQELNTTEELLPL